MGLRDFRKSLASIGKIGVSAPFLPVLKPAQTITLPVYTAYPDPAPDGAFIDEEAGTLKKWKSPRTKIEWGGWLGSEGSLSVSARIRLPKGVHAVYRLSTGRFQKDAPLVGTGKVESVDFGTCAVAGADWRTFFLQGVSSSSGFGDLKSLNLSGEPLKNAKFNLKSRRNAASVHLNFPNPKGEQVDWFYNEVIGLKDPYYTYYEACGFARGYFGMQVNEPHERRIIFSIWDAGKEAVDRKKVNKADQVQLLAKGPKVFAGSFGNEGTGGHSHLSYHWRTGSVQRFLVHAQPKGDTTTYTAYFFDPDTNQWRLIASFLAPHDGAYLHGLYSFVEDYVGDNGNRLRKAEYGPAWVHTRTGGWKLLSTARFTHDGTGGKDRFDYDFGVEHGRFFLQNGGFQGKSPKLNSIAHLPDQPLLPPDVDLDALKKLATEKE